MFVGWPFSLLSGRTQAAFDFFPYLGRAGAHSDPRLLHGFHFIFRFSRSTRNDRAGVTHAAARRRGLTSDETDHRFLHMLLDVSRGGLLCVPTYLANHDDG